MTDSTKSKTNNFLSIFSRLKVVIKLIAICNYKKKICAVSGWMREFSILCFRAVEKLYGSLANKDALWLHKFLVLHMCAKTAISVVLLRMLKHWQSQNIHIMQSFLNARWLFLVGETTYRQRQKSIITMNVCGAYMCK